MSDSPSGIHRRPRPLEAIPIEELTAAADQLGGVRRQDLEVGDRVVVSTRNSVYSLTLRRDGTFEVRGGWYERKSRGAARVRVLGCTAGGHALFSEQIAAPGLFLELADGVRTTRIRSVRRIPSGSDQT